jgi:hypothetical protein
MNPGGINLEVVLYGALAIAALVMIAASFFLFKSDSSRNQITFAIGLGGLFIGLAAGMLTMFLLQGAMPQAKAAAPTAEATAPIEGNRRAMAPAMMGIGGGRFASLKGQLATLVEKLNLLTDKPLTLQLSDDQKKRLREQVQGLQDIQELSDAEVQKRIEAVQDAIKDQREILEAVGYRWSTPGEGSQGPMGAGPGMGGGPRMPGMGRGSGGNPPPEMSPNPFADGKNRKSLEALQDRLAPTKTKTSQ